MSQPHVAIVGATGAVGIEMLRCLERRNFPVGKLTLLASARSAGKKLTFRGEEHPIQELTPESFAGVNIALFSAGGGLSRDFAPHAVKAGAVVVDNSSAFRMDDTVPLVVPEINAGTASLIATAINPAIGLGSFLAQIFLRRPLMEAATQEFHVDGSWVDPRITKVARRAPAAASEPATTEK